MSFTMINTKKQKLLNMQRSKQMWPVIKRSVEADPQMTDILEIAEKDFKIVIINMIEGLQENMDKMGEQTEVSGEMGKVF